MRGYSCRISAETSHLKHLSYLFQRATFEFGTMSSIFSVIGDSNIRNHVNKNSCRANPALKAAQTLSCGNMSILPATLEKVRPESNACILACLTNFLTDADGPPTVSLRVGPVLQVPPLLYYLISLISGRIIIFGS